MIVALSDTSDTGEVRRQATMLAGELSFDPEATGKVAIAATELATNILKHAGRGEIAITAWAAGALMGIELLALDRGPGMADLSRCFEDGYSTAGSPGSGLGALRRLADEVSLFSRPGQGTVAMARLHGRRPTARQGPFEIGGIAANCPGETVCGDDGAVVESDGFCRLFMADGSGHGPEAAHAATLATRVFRDHRDLPPPALLAVIHQALASTRGAAVAAAVIERAAQCVKFAGLGNIAGTLIDGAQTRRMVSFGGTAGHTWRSVKEFTYPFTTSDPIVILHSDGIARRWDVQAYPGLTRCHASVIAGVLYRDFSRGRDDASVLVVRVVAP